MARSNAAADVLSNMRVLNVVGDIDPTNPIQVAKGQALKFDYEPTFDNTIKLRFKRLNDPEMNFRPRTMVEKQTQIYPKYVFAWLLNSTGTQVLTLEPFASAIYSRDPVTGIMTYVNGSANNSNDTMLEAVLPTDELELRLTISKPVPQQISFAVSLYNLTTPANIVLLQMDGDPSAFAGFEFPTFYSGFPPTMNISSYDNHWLLPIFSEPNSAGADYSLLYTGSEMTGA